MFTFEFKIIKSVKLTSLSSESRVFFFLLDQTGLKGAMNDGKRCNLTRVYTTASGEGLQNKSVDAQVFGPFVRLHFKTFFFRMATVLALLFTLRNYIYLPFRVWQLGRENVLA